MIHQAPLSEGSVELEENVAGVYVEGHRDVEDDEIGRERNDGSKIPGDAGSSNVQDG